jgi:hypothetical protein
MPHAPVNIYRKGPPNGSTIKPAAVGNPQIWHAAGPRCAAMRAPAQQRLHSHRCHTTPHRRPPKELSCRHSRPDARRARSRRLGAAVAARGRRRAPSRPSRRSGVGGGAPCAGGRQRGRDRRRRRRAAAAAGELGERAVAGGGRAARCGGWAGARGRVFIGLQL